MISYPTIGLMSGTSMDGIDAILVYTNGKKITRTKFKSITPYSKETYDLLQIAVKNPIKFINNKDFYDRLSYLITCEHAKVVEELIFLSKVKPYLIGFHGQTIFHDVGSKISYQLGDGKLLSKLLELNVVHNFRNKDLSFGGQGAPIAPIYHKYILQSLNVDLPAIIINIGGISNLTYWDGKKIIGFDTGPGNNLIDYCMKRNFNLDYDDKGFHASKGNVNFNLIKKYTEDLYYSKSPPKSLERKYLFENKHLKEIYNLDKYDCIATLCALTSTTIKMGVKLLPKKPNVTILVGGGQKNKHLVKLVKKTINSSLICTGEEISLDSDYIEAELIAFLAGRKIYNLPSTFPDTTGVKRNTILGDLIKFKS